MSEFILSQTETFALLNGDFLVLDRGVNTFKIKKENMPAQSNSVLIATNIADIALAEIAIADNAVAIDDNDDDIAINAADIAIIGAIESTKVIVSSAQILSLNTNPIQLIDIGASAYIDVISITILSKYGSSAYVTGGDLQIKGTTNQVGTLSENLYTGSVNKIYKMRPTSAAIIDGSSIFITTASSDPTAGDGSLEVSITFKRI